MTVLIIVQNRVALTESATTAVLTAQANTPPLGHESCQCQRFRCGPVQRSLARCHFSPRLDGSDNFRVRMKALRESCLQLQQRREARAFYARNASGHLTLQSSAIIRPNSLQFFAHRFGAIFRSGSE